MPRQRRPGSEAVARVREALTMPGPIVCVRLADLAAVFARLDARAAAQARDQARKVAAIGVAAVNAKAARARYRPG